MKTILVTGGAGFLGKNVSFHLIEQGYDVVVFDQKEVEDIRFIQGDLVSFDDVYKATQNVDAVCHLGAIGDIYLATTNPALAVAVNVVGTSTLIEACRRNKVKRIVYASTWEVYGKPQYEPMDEAHPCAPLHPYNVTKLAGEQLLFSAEKTFQLPVLSLRLGTSYGKWMRKNSVFSIFIEKAMKGETIQIHGEGKQFRQFVHAKDVAEAFRLALESKVSGIPVNIIGEEFVTIRELAETVRKKIPTKVEYLPAREGDIPPAKVSSEKAGKILGWKPVISFKEGLEELISWYKENVNA